MRFDTTFRETSRTFNAVFKETPGNFGTDFGSHQVIRGVSPTINVTDIEGGTRLKITDVNGEKVVDIEDGKDGADGKTAYEYARDGGYTGTEEEFKAKLAGNFAPMARLGEVTLVASEWVGNENLYSQVVNIDGVTENSQVDLTPSVEQLAVFYEKDLTFVTENEDGVVTVFAIGQKPQNDYTVQVTITEVTW